MDRTAIAAACFALCALIAVGAWLKALTWSSLSTDLITLSAPETGNGQPQRFIPVFETLADAEKFTGEDERHLIVEIQEAKNCPPPEKVTG